MNFVLNPQITFGVDVKIPVPGKDEPSVLGFTFRHRKVSEMAKAEALLMDRLTADDLTAEGRVAAQVDHLLFVAEDWALSRQKRNPIPLTAEALSQLVDNYPTAFNAVMESYACEMNGIRRKN